MAYRSPKDLADSMARRRKSAAADDGYVRETFTQPREQARVTARAFLDEWPAAAYMSQVEFWRELPGDQIEFTMKRLKARTDANWDSGRPSIARRNMPTRCVTIHGKRHKVTTEQLTAALWIASGECDGDHYSTESSTEKSALRRWQEWAERKVWVAQ